MSENVMAEELRCSICCETMANPAMIFRKNCLHRYCYECIKNHENFNFELRQPSECPGRNYIFLRDQTISDTNRMQKILQG